MSRTKRRPWPKAIVIITFAIGVFVVACLDTDVGEVDNGPDQPYLGPRSECSTGPAYSYDQKFPEGPRESPQPECIRRCGEHPAMTWGSSGGAGGPSPTTEAVPSGSCAYEAEACSMVAVRPCCSPEGQTGQAFLYECRCKNNTWSCLATFHGGGACTCADGSVVDDEAGTTPGENDAGTSSDADSGGD